MQEFRIGSFEYEFVDANGHREVELHIPSDAHMSISGKKFGISKGRLLLDKVNQMAD